MKSNPILLGVYFMQKNGKYFKYRDPLNKGVSMEIICINHKTTRMPHGKYPHFSMAHLEGKLRSW